MSLQPTKYVPVVSDKPLYQSNVSTPDDHTLFDAPALSRDEPVCTKTQNFRKTHLCQHPRLQPLINFAFFFLKTDSKETLLLHISAANDRHTIPCSCI